MPWYVQIIESEAGWGQRVDETLDFGEDREAAVEYVREFNRKNTESSTPDWYMRAEAPVYRDALVKGAKRAPVKVSGQETYYALDILKDGHVLSTTFKAAEVTSETLLPAVQQFFPEVKRCGYASSSASLLSYNDKGQLTDLHRIHVRPLRDDLPEEVRAELQQLASQGLLGPALSALANTLK